MALSETTMLIMLGFVLGLLVVLLLGRLAWGVAMAAADRRRAKSLPASIVTLQSERDRLRAEHAMMAQKLDSRLEEAKMRMAEHMAEVTRARNSLALMTQDIAAHEKSLTERDAEIVRLRGELAIREADIKGQAALIEQLTTQAQLRDGELTARIAEISRLNRHRPQAPLPLPAEGAAPAAAPDHPSEVRIHQRITELTNLSRQMDEERDTAPVLAEGKTWVKEAGANAPLVETTENFAERLSQSGNDNTADAGTELLAGIPSPGEAPPAEKAPPRPGQAAMTRRIRSLQGGSAK